MKKSEKNIENFYQAALFTFNTYQCYCAIDTINVGPDNYINDFKIMHLSDKPIKFAFEPQKGLVRINTKNGAIEEDNILSSLISIKPDDINSYKKFFEKNGFLFPIKPDSFEKIDDESLLNIIDRMRCTLELISQISEVAKKDYKKIFALILYLMFSKPIKIKIGELEYVTCSHNKIYDALKIAADKPAKFNFKYDSEYMFEVKDSILKTYKMHMDLYRHKLGDEFESDFWNSVFHAYFNYQDAPKDVRLMIEFLYHIYFDMGQIVNFERDTLNFCYPSQVNWDYFNDDMKKASLEIAKIIIGEEINSNLSGVYPEYDIKDMEPKWRVSSLLSALYFSLFYMRPNVEITRLCANPKCGRYFTVNRTSAKKKYCCPECANRANQNNYRARHKK